MLEQGKHKGKKGYYDNEETDCQRCKLQKKCDDAIERGIDFDEECPEECDCAVVYMGTPFECDFILVPFEHIEKIPDEQFKPLIDFRKNQPEKAKFLGV